MTITGCGEREYLFIAVQRRAGEELHGYNLACYLRERIDWPQGKKKKVVQMEEGVNVMNRFRYVHEAAIFIGKLKKVTERSYCQPTDQIETFAQCLTFFKHKPQQAIINCYHYYQPK